MTRGNGPIWLAAIGDVTDPATFSGTPYHCLEAGRAAGIFAGGLTLSANGLPWRLRRTAWNLGELFAGRGCGGFQYSDAFLDRLFGDLAGTGHRAGRRFQAWTDWAPPDEVPADGVPPDELLPRRPPKEGACFGCEGIRLLNFFQLFPQRITAEPHLPRWFYIDQTLRQLFASYTLALPIPLARQEEAIRRERAQYLTADGVVCHSAWAAASVGHDYGVPAEKIHVVLPGANLPAAALARWEAIAPAQPPPRREGEPLRLVFVGKDWRRKGLDRLLRALPIAAARGVSIRLVVIGVAPSSLPAALTRTPGVSWPGVVDKSADPDRFIALLAGADVGCLLSRAEAGGISLREFVRLGLPTIAPDVGGAPEYVVPAATTLVAPDAGDETIADHLVALAADRDRLQQQRQAAWAARRTAGWDRSVAQLGAILSASP